MSDQPNDCVDNELLAAFIDNRLSLEQRVRVLRHLDECEDCFELFSEVSQLRLEEFEEEAQADSGPATPTRPAGRKGWLWAPLTAAAAILLAVFILFSAAAVAPVAQIVGPLMEDGAELIAHLPTSAAPAFADPPASQVDFLLGTLVADLYVAASRDAPAETARFRDRVQRVLANASLDADLEQTDDAQRVARLDERLADRLDSRRYRLGKWCEALRLAAASGQTHYFRRPEVETFLDSSEARSLPAPARQTLRRLRSQSDPLQQRDDLATLQRQLSGFIAAGGRDR